MVQTEVWRFFLSLGFRKFLSGTEIVSV
jgi:hypothetical protein